MALIYGEIKQSDRDKILEDFKSGKYKIIIANPTTLNAGVTVTNSRIMVFMDRDFKHKNDTSFGTFS